MATTHSLSAAMKDMPDVLEKDATFTGRNASYDYASKDSLFVGVRSALAAVGLAPWQQEVKFDLLDAPDGGAPVIHAVYEFAMTPDGKPPEPDTPCERVTVFNRLDGSLPQRCAGTRAFGVKYWLLNKLLLATGELEDDADAHDAPPPSKAPAKAQQQEQAAEADGQWTLDPDTMKFQLEGQFPDERTSQRHLYAMLMNLIIPGADPEKASEVYAANMELIESLPTAGQKVLLQRIKQLQEGADQATDQEIDADREAAEEAADAS